MHAKLVPFLLGVVLASGTSKGGFLGNDLGVDHAITAIGGRTENQSVVAKSISSHNLGHHHDSNDDKHNDENKGTGIDAAARNLLQTSSAWWIATKSAITSHHAAARSLLQTSSSMTSLLQTHDGLFSKSRLQGSCCECNNGEFRFSASNDCEKHCKSRDGVSDISDVGPNGKADCHAKRDSNVIGTVKDPDADGDQEAVCTDKFKGTRGQWARGLLRPERDAACKRQIFKECRVCRQQTCADWIAEGGAHTSPCRWRGRQTYETIEAVDESMAHKMMRGTGVTDACCRKLVEGSTRLVLEGEQIRPGVYRGRPEVYTGEEWVPICGHWFWDNDFGASAFCSKLGFPSGRVEKLGTSYDVASIFIGRCKQGEDLLSCPDPPKSGKACVTGCAQGKNLIVKDRLKVKHNKCPAESDAAISVQCEEMEEWDEDPTCRDPEWRDNKNAVEATSSNADHCNGRCRVSNVIESSELREAAENYNDAWQVTVNKQSKTEWLIVDFGERPTPYRTIVIEWGSWYERNDHLAAQDYYVSFADDKDSFSTKEYQVQWKNAKNSDGFQLFRTNQGKRWESMIGNPPELSRSSGPLRIDSIAVNGGEPLAKRYAKITMTKTIDPWEDKEKHYSYRIRRVFRSGCSS